MNSIHAITITVIITTSLKQNAKKILMLTNKCI